MTINILKVSAIKAQKVTIKDVAKLAGVSVSTVSMIINGKNNFPEKTCRKVIDACNTLGYVRKESPLMQHDDEKLLIAIVPTLSNLYFVHAVEAMQQRAKEFGYSIVTFETLRERSQEAKITQLCSKFPFSGVVFFYPPENGMFLSKLQTEKPVLYVYDKGVYDEADIFEFDGLRVGKMIAEYLISLGHRRIAYLSLDFEMKQVLRERRLEGMRAAFEENGYDPMDSVILCTPEIEFPDVKKTLDGYELGYKITEKLISTNKNISAIVGLNDMIAFGAIDAILDAGKKVPNDFSVCGCDNVNVANYRSISLTTVDSYPKQVGKEAVDFIIRKINQTGFLSGQKNTPAGVSRIEYFPRLVIRKSTGPRKK